MTAARTTHIRYIVLALAVLVFLITYLDRGLMASALPTIQKEFDLPIEKVGLVLACYNLAYALFQIPGGWLGDRIGPRLALSAVVLWWSAFTFLIGLSGSPIVLMVFLFLFGAGEAGAFPIANRALSRWMLPAERGFAQGITHAGSRVGGTLAPIAMTSLIVLAGWRVALMPFALVGVVWAGVWYWFYRDSPATHGAVGEAERARIAAALGTAPGRAHVPWKRILSAPQLWILAAMYFCYGYDLNMFLSWFPKYLNAARGYTLLQTGYFASLTLGTGIVGDICGGFFSDLIIRRTGRIKFARQSIAIAGFLLMAVFVPIAVSAPTPYLTAFLFGVAVFGMELTVGNSWAVTLDIGGSYAGSVSAVMNTFGNMGGALVTAATGFIVKSYGWHAAFYVVSALAVVAALLFLKIDASRKLALEAPARRRSLAPKHLARQKQSHYGPGPMEPFRKLEGVAAPLPMTNVDTDMIIPKQYLKTIRRTGLGKALFDELRTNPDGSEKPEFVLNKPAYRGAKILVAGANFGCGSSREHAPWALLDFGIRCIIAPSFADIFFNNCFKNGILPIALPQADVDKLMDDAERGANAVISVDLEAQEIRGPDGGVVTFKLDSFRKQCLLNGWDDIDLTLHAEDRISAYEARHKAETPWL